MVNIEKLEAKVKDTGMTVIAICEKAGITKQTYYNRLKNPNFTINEVNELQKVMHLTDAEVREIFFA